MQIPLGLLSHVGLIRADEAMKKLLAHLCTINFRIFLHNCRFLKTVFVFFLNISLWMHVQHIHLGHICTLIDCSQIAGYDSEIASTEKWACKQNAINHTRWAETIQARAH